MPRIRAFAFLQTHPFRYTWVHIMLKNKLQGGEEKTEKEHTMAKQKKEWVTFLTSGGWVSFKARKKR